MAATTTTATVVVVPSTPPAPAAAGSPRAAVVEVSDDDDVPPPGWDQWASLPASAPEASLGALVVRGDVGAALGAQRMVSEPRRRTLDLRHVRSRSGSVPASRRPTSLRLRRSRGCGRSSVTTALRSTGRFVWRVFQVSWISSSLAVPAPALFRVRAFPDSCCSRLARWR
jgi:hypothetical protein